MNIELLRKLSNAFGPPGTEAEPREILREELESYADEVIVDKLGNILFVHNGEEDAPKIMIAAHMDEVGFMVTYIEKNGFLRFHSWGIPNNVFLGQRMILHGKKGKLHGIIGTKPPHVMTDDERNKVAPQDSLFIDIGTLSKEEAVEKGAYIGMRGTFDVEFLELGNGFLRGKALDDRLGCFMMAEAFKLLSKSTYNVTVVGTVQEEVGTRGARTAAYQIDPDYAIALECTYAVDIPGTPPHKQSTEIRKGAVLSIADRSLIAHPKVLGAMVEAAEAENIPYQYKKLASGGTDAGAISLSRSGVPSGVISCPSRYIHGPAAIVHTEDVENIIKLVQAFVKRISS